MAKPFGEAKHPKNWLRNQSVKEFLNELSKVRICASTDLVQVVHGGSNPGTWFHKDVALEFARWLSPAFAIWCNDKIKEILLGNYKQVERIPDYNYTIDMLKIVQSYVDSIMHHVLRDNGIAQKF